MSDNEQPKTDREPIPEKQTPQQWPINEEASRRLGLNVSRGWPPQGGDEQRPKESGEGQQQDKSKTD